jgi:hypothetical protein
LLPPETRHNLKWLLCLDNIHKKLARLMYDEATYDVDTIQNHIFGNELADVTHAAFVF